MDDLGLEPRTVVQMIAILALAAIYVIGVLVRLAVGLAYARWLKPRECFKQVSIALIWPVALGVWLSRRWRS